MTTTTKKKIITKVTALLYARRSGNVRREQKAYESLMAVCVANNLDFADTLSQTESYLRKTSIAANMNGIV